MKVMTDRSSTLRVAAIQTAPIAFNKQKTLEKAAKLTAEASAQGAKLVVFPESFVPGYPSGVAMFVGTRTPEQRVFYAHLMGESITIPGDDVDYLAAIARDNRVFLAIGVIERINRSLYCTTLYFSPEGQYLGKHQKLKPTAAERVIWGDGDPATLQSYASPWGKIGGLICNENFMPLARTALYAQGVAIYVAPTLNDREVWSALMQTIAFEGRCFVISACQYARRSDYPKDYDNFRGNNPETVFNRGGSMIVAPLGKVLAGPVYNTDAILVADIDLAEIEQSSLDMDAVGHYARPDALQLMVSRKSGRSVIFED
ncbi:MAG TPA: carbon-nitrogen hydrolase family protein [Candidatus Saccharimonadales bacterium]|nr:carbon-nitrogen hydrolase family protein [Candidatus Saccharimonadales bacterium]